MATAIAAQLAQIRAKSTNSHDLKAQKKAHSQSLLFDAPTAATQDFDLVYQICQEGFEELCRLDARFTKFASNIFSEQSKHEDRTQMTTAQNQQLDVVLEEFLSLIGSKMLLKPAIKAVEWLVRRFRTHENNTLSLVLTFLPYHTTAMFTTLLSILPSTILPTLKFLHPYIQSLANPPRHAIVYTASHSRPFLAALNSYMLKTCRFGYQYPTLTSFWASTTTEAVAAMLDQARSARRESQRENEGDVALFLLPVINEGLSFEGMPDLRVGCYMLLTVLASKTDLDAGVITAAMQAVATEWTQTSHAGLICLSVLAQRLHQPQLPKRAFQAIIALENLDDDLRILQRQYKVDKLVLGVIMGILTNLHKTQAPSGVQLVRSLIENNLMDETCTVQAIESILSIIRSSEAESGLRSDIQGSLVDLVLHLADSGSIGTLVQGSMAAFGLGNNQSGASLQRTLSADGNASDRMIENATMENPGEQVMTDDFDILVNRIPMRTAYEISFLSHSDSYIFGNLEDAFSRISTTEANVEKFSNLPVLRKSLATNEPLFISFYIRIWCGNGPANVRAAAIRTISRYVEKEPLTADLQILFPYAIYALADPIAKARRAATELVASLSRAYEEMIDASQKGGLPILGQESVYGAGKETKELVWLSLDENRRFLASVLVPGLQECLLDQSHISQLLSDNLIGSKHRKWPTTIHKELKMSLRLSIFSYLCSHVVNMPLCRVKSRLLCMLNQVTKVGNTSRSKLLFPLLSHFSKLPEEEYRRICRKEELEPSQFLDQIMCIITSTDRDSVECLKIVIESGVCPTFSGLRVAALNRLKAIWPSMKPDIQKNFADTLLEQALADSAGNASDNAQIESMETVRSLPLSTTILHSFFATLSSTSPHLQEKPPAPKRRRTSHGRSMGKAVNPKTLSLAMKRMTLVLELVEDAKAERHPEILKDLFQVLSLLQPSQNFPTEYLLILTLDSMLAIIQKIDMSASLPIEHSAIRTDVLIDCVRNTVSPQVRNAALLLVATLASITPDLVLHSIMPIFTFMGADILRQDDDYSAYVVKQTMEFVIPRLVQSLHTKKQSHFEGICELLLSFAAAFRHIPAQRRLPLFTSLVEKVGASEHLFALLAILIDKYPDDQRVLRFAFDLANSYSWDIRLQTLASILEVILDAQNPKRSLSASLLTSSKNRSVGTVTASLLHLPSMVLEDQVLTSQIQRELGERGETNASVRSLHAQLLENTFLLAEKFKANEKPYFLCMRLLDASLNLLPFRNMVDSLQILLERTGDNVRQQVLRSFKHRLSEDRTDQENTQTACLAFLPGLRSIIEESPNLSLKLVAVSLVDKITAKFGKKAIPTIIDNARTIMSNVCFGAAEISLRVIALLCLATMVEVLGENFIPLVPDTFSKALDNLTLSIQEDTDDADLHNAVYAYMTALLLDLPWTILGPDLERFLNVSYESANAGMGTECDERRAEAMQLVAKQAEGKGLFSALKRTWPNAIAQGPLAVKEYVDVLHLAIDGHPKSTIVKESETLGNLFMRMFDLRRIQLLPPTEDSYTVGEVKEVEDSVNESAIAMVYKLNDATFRPLFSKMLSWSAFSESSDKSARIHRQITWYRFLLKFFSTLKSIVTSYAGFILDDSVEILTQRQPDDEDSILLWRQVVLTLHKTFEHDQDDFYQSPNHFSPISTALLSQLASAAQKPLLPELIPAIIELAVATDSSAHHKEMNNAILQYLRSDSPAVRLTAVQCERALTERLGEEWLALLPEMLPFISEALEDDDEVVEREVQRWVVSIEGILGESLNPMLQ